jgi:hypothetical protein
MNKVKKKTKIVWRSKKEMFAWNIINSILAGTLVFTGAFTDGIITKNELLIMLGISILVMITKLKEFWDTQEGVYRPMLFHFIH